MKATFDQLNQLSLLAKNLWKNQSLNLIKEVIKKYIEDDEKEVFVNIVDNKCIGLALVSLRYDYVEGCKSSPVGYLEAIVVDKKYQKTGVATILCKECEVWAKGKACTEFASDCEINNEASYLFHLAVGFKEENRIIHFAKKI